MSDEIKKDRFRQPVYETVAHVGADVYERDALVAQLVLDVVAAVIRQVGRKEARRLFDKALKSKRGGKGKKEDREVNADLLAEHDRLVAGGCDPSHAPSRVAEHVAAPKEDPKSVEKRLRRALEKRRKAEVKSAKDRASAAKTILGKALFPDADI